MLLYLPKFHKNHLWSMIIDWSYRLADIVLPQIRALYQLLKISVFFGCGTLSSKRLCNTSNLPELQNESKKSIWMPRLQIEFQYRSLYLLWNYFLESLCWWDQRCYRLLKRFFAFRKLQMEESKWKEQRTSKNCVYELICQDKTWANKVQAQYKLHWVEAIAKQKQVILRSRFPIFQLRNL